MSQTPVPNVPQLLASLEIVQRWRQETEAEIRGQVKEIDEDEERLKNELAELQRQLKSVAALRDEVTSRLAELDDEQLDRTREAVLSGLEADGPLLEARAEALREVEAEHEKSVAALLNDPEISGLVEEYKQFLEAEPTLDMLPAGYRKAVLAHHESIKAKLKPVVAAADVMPQPLPLEPAGFTLVASLDPPEGTPEALALIVPVPYDVFAKWSDRGEDLHAQIAYRVVGAVSAMLAELGSAQAPVQYAPLEGKLLIQVWLGDVAVEGDVKASLERQVAHLRLHASELAVLRLEPYLVWLAPEAILPDDEDDDVDLEEEDDG